MKAGKRKLSGADNQRRLALIEKAQCGRGFTSEEQGKLARLQAEAGDSPEGGKINPKRLAQLRRKNVEVKLMTKRVRKNRQFGQFGLRGLVD